MSGVDYDALFARGDELDAFVAHGKVVVPPSGAGVLDGVAFSVKDHFAVAGVPSGNGNPTWLEHNPVPTETAPIIRRLLDAGGTLVGKTQMDELGWSISGVNAHYGIPVNGAAPERIAGGSSSGSASVVSAGLVPFALGADSGGSIRTPASYCGILGMRASYGRIPVEHGGSTTGATGWFARDVELFATVGSILIDGFRTPATAGRVLIADDLFAETEPGVADSFAPALDAVQSVLGPAEHISLAEGRIADWAETFRLVQAAENWAALGDWITRYHPVFGADIAARFEAAAVQPPDVTAAARQGRIGIRSRVADVLADHAVLIAPSAVGPALPRSCTIDDLERRRAAAFRVLCPTGLAGLAQLSLPLARHEGAPLGIALIAAPGEDELLLELARAIMHAQE